MYIGRVLYWLFTGALLGFGVIGIASIGGPFLLLGLLLLIVGAIRLGSVGLWAGLFSFGALSASILVCDLTSRPWACASTASGGALPSPNYFSDCVDTFLGPLTPYHLMAIGFGVIALAGLVWPLLHQLSVRRHHAGA